LANSVRVRARSAIVFSKLICSVCPAPAVSIISSGFVAMTYAPDGPWTYVEAAKVSKRR
jgi:hypothetical protein